MDTKINLTYYRLRANSRPYRNLVDKTIREIEDSLGRHPKSYVSWSAGKDSQVLLDIVKTVDDGHYQVPILMADCGVPFHWTARDKQTMENWLIDSGWWTDLRYFPWDKWGNPSLQNTHGQEYRDAVHQDQFAELNGWTERNGYTMRLDGMRIAEGGKRSILLRSTGGVRKTAISPLANWTTDDIWTYLVRNDVPWLEIYDACGPEVRNGMIGRNGKESGRLVYLKKYFPQEFLLACETFNARDYV